MRATHAGISLPFSEITEANAAITHTTVRGMFTGVLRYRSRDHRTIGANPQNPDEVLARLLGARSLHPHRFVRDCEIGPFVVDHVCREQALVIDLSRTHREAETRRKFLESLGYRVLNVSRRDLYQSPDGVLGRVRRLLQAG